MNKNDFNRARERYPQALKISDITAVVLTDCNEIRPRIVSVQPAGIMHGVQFYRVVDETGDTWQMSDKGPYLIYQDVTLEDKSGQWDESVFYTLAEFAASALNTVPDLIAAD